MEECAYITEYFALVSERWHQISGYFIFVRETSRDVLLSIPFSWYVNWMTLNPRSKLRNVRVELKSAVKVTMHFSSSFLLLVYFDIRAPCCFFWGGCVCVCVWVCVCVCFAFIVRFDIELRVESETLNVDWLKGYERFFLGKGQTSSPGSSRFPISRWQTGRPCVATCTLVRMCVPEKNVQYMEPRIQTRIYE